MYVYVFHFRDGSNPVFPVLVVDVVPAVRIDEFRQFHFVISLETNVLRQFRDERTTVLFG
jgi:hypothetical protein